MKKARLAALFTAVMMGMMSCSGTPAYAEERGTILTAEAEEKESASDDGQEKEADDTSGSEKEAGILSTIPLDSSVMAHFTAGMDPDIVEALLENPKLMALFKAYGTLHADAPRHRDG